MENIIFTAVSLLFIGLTIFDFARVHGKRRQSLNYMWLPIIIFLPLIGAILYWLMGRTSVYRRKSVFNPDFRRNS